MIKRKPVKKKNIKNPSIIDLSKYLHRARYYVVTYKDTFTRKFGHSEEIDYKVRNYSYIYVLVEFKKEHTYPYRNQDLELYAILELECLKTSNYIGSDDYSYFEDYLHKKQIEKLDTEKIAGLFGPFDKLSKAKRVAKYVLYWDEMFSSVSESVFLYTAKITKDKILIKPGFINEKM